MAAAKPLAFSRIQECSCQSGEAKPGKVVWQSWVPVEDKGHRRTSSVCKGAMGLREP